MREKGNMMIAGALKAALRNALESGFTGYLLIVLVPALLFFGHAFGYDEWQAPSGQPDQMWSKVEYDPKLTDPFFNSNEWSYPWYIIKHRDGHFEDTTSDKNPEGEPPRLKHTAKCFSTAKGAEHLVEFCEARLFEENTIGLLLNHDSAAFFDRLKIRIKDGMFTCQFWTLYQAGPSKGLMWTTKRQNLTLDKKIYRKGDVIKGRIDFECLDELINPQYPDRPPRPIRVFGVFKTTVK